MIRRRKKQIKKAAPKVEESKTETPKSGPLKSLITNVDPKKAEAPKPEEPKAEEKEE